MLLRHSDDFIPALRGSAWFLLAMSACYFLPVWLGNQELQNTLAQMWLMFAALSMSPLIRTFARQGVVGWLLLLPIGCIWLPLTVGVLTHAFGLMPSSDVNYWQVGFSIIYMVLAATVAEAFIRYYVWQPFGRFYVQS